MGTAVEERGGTRFYGVGYGMGRVCVRCGMMLCQVGRPRSRDTEARRVDVGDTRGQRVSPAFLVNKRRKNSF